MLRRLLLSKYLLIEVEMPFVPMQIYLPFVFLRIQFLFTNISVFIDIVSFPFF